jgi:hypothetical protein
LLGILGIGNEDVVEQAKMGWPKTCACGETWSREQWGELTPVGRYRAEEWIELRTCVCGKTLVVSANELGEQANSQSR